MREVNNNPELGKIPARAEIKFSGRTDEAAPKTETADEKSTQSFDNPKEVLGRAQVNNLNALNNDINFGMKNPETIEKANKFFDLAYAQTGDYAKAAEMTDAYVKEFCAN